MKKVFSHFLFTFIAALALVAGARDLGQDEALHLREQGTIISLETVMALLDKRYPHSSVLDIELEEENAQYIYEVELLTQTGIVRDIDMNAHNGKIIKDEEDD